MEESSYSRLEKPISVRRTSIEDRVATWWWRNDNCSQLLAGRPSLSWSRHKELFGILLNDPNVYPYTGHVQTVRVGIVRFDETVNGVFRLSLYVRPIFIHRGASRPLVEKAISAIESKKFVEEIFVHPRSQSLNCGDLFNSIGFNWYAEEGVFRKRRSEGTVS